MIMERIGARSVLGGCVLGLVFVVVLGGFLMAVAEGIGYTKGLWAVFNVATTTGFGEGPTSGLGQLVAACAFAAAAVCWFGIISVAVEVGLSRYERNALVRSAAIPCAPARSEAVSQQLRGIA